MKKRIIPFALLAVLSPMRRICNPTQLNIRICNPTNIETI